MARSCMSRVAHDGLALTADAGHCYQASSVEGALVRVKSAKRHQLQKILFV